METKIRKDVHAGSWYSDDKDELKAELTSYLEKATNQPSPSVKAVISPHAGYMYSGPTAAYAFKALDFTGIKRVFVLGPSHFTNLIGGGSSSASVASTPFGDLKLDTDIQSELVNQPSFMFFPLKLDEYEHSIEMQLPYLKLVSKDNDFTTILVNIGDLDDTVLSNITKSLQQHFDDDSSLFIISTDFCHWGPNYDFFPGKEESDLDSFVNKLDKEALDAIVEQNLEKFDDHCSRTNNNICGKTPVRVLISLMNNSKHKYSVELLDYTKTIPVKSMEDSTVGYASLLINKI